MCGIWGFAGLDTPFEIANAWNGLCALDHRGPDAWGFYTEEDGIVRDPEPIPTGSRRLFLGNRRLSILDPSPAGNQPMIEDGAVLVYNGEVYNYSDLREELRQAGHEFSSDTDTEVVLAAYREWGLDCVERFRGMFAFAIYDTDRNRIVLARDRLGIKPLYYTDVHGGVAFSSELTALLDGNIVERQLDQRAVAEFLRFGFVPEPRTIIKGVEPVPAGSVISHDLDTGETDTVEYWSPSFGDDAPDVDELRESLRESVCIRRRSDVPLGAFLSGGLDSSSIVALLKDGDGSIHTCSVGFSDVEDADTEFAASVAEEFGTNHHPRTIGGEDVAASIPNIVESMDQPSVDAVNTYFVSESAANSGLTVALSGLGSDELFFGYPTFEHVRRGYLLGRFTQLLPGSVRRGLATVLSRVGKMFRSRAVSALGEVVRSEHPFGASYVAARGVFSAETVSSLMNTHFDPEQLPARVASSVAPTLRNTDLRAAISHAELRWYMRDQLLRDTDAMSMAHSLEVRVPFLDTKFVEFVTATGSKWKRQGTKELLKDAVSDIVPPIVRNRKKRGFVLPFDEWLRGDLQPVVDDALNQKFIQRTPLNMDAVERVRTEFEQGQRHWERLWILVVLSLWIDEHIVTNRTESEQPVDNKCSPGTTTDSKGCVSDRTPNSCGEPK